MFCPKCGKELNTESKFCARCGNKITPRETTTLPPADITPPQETQQAAATEAPPVSQETAPSTQTAPSNQNAQNNQAIKKGKSRAPLIAAVLIVLFLALGAGGAVMGRHFGIFDDMSLPEPLSFLASNKAGETRDSGDAQIDEDADLNDTTNENNSEDEIANIDAEPTEAEPEQPAPIEIKPLSMSITQVDSSAFPRIVLFASIFGEDGEVVSDLKKDHFSILETDSRGGVYNITIDELRQIQTTESVSMNLVLDQSGSMGDYGKMGQAKSAAMRFLSEISPTSGDQIEISSFDDYVYIRQPFTSEYSLLANAIDGLSPTTQTALYDAICSSLLSTVEQAGAKCVVIFTDGQENASSYSYQDVVDLSLATGIPVFIIGIGDDVNDAELERLAWACNGEYFYANWDNLGDTLARIYSTIYLQQRDWYTITCTSQSTSDPGQKREFLLSAVPETGFSGEAARDYIPKADLNTAFGSSFRNKDFIIPDSSSRVLTENDLKGLSLAELRIARNEIFARHGRQFKDALLNKWFYSKDWYMRLPRKYSPADFDRAVTLPKLEEDNAIFILNYENRIIETSEIFPQSSAVLLTEYDLSLTKVNLQRGLEELYAREGVPFGVKSALPQTALQNAEMIEDALSRADINY